MKAFLSGSALLLASVMPSIEGGAFTIDLLPVHSVYHEREQEAGVVAAISITPGQHNAADLKSLCEDLRVATGLEHMTSDGLALKLLFVVPYKEMAIEGYYFPTHDEPGSETLIPGNRLARNILDGIVDRAGIPAGVLDETGVELEISCRLDEPAWHVRWEDIRPVDGEEPNTVIERAHRRLMTIYRAIVDRSMETSLSTNLR